MTNLWLFGDSFATVRNLNYHDLTDDKMPQWVWMQQVARNLPIDTAHWCGLPGVSNEWIMNEIKKYTKDFNKGDYLIVTSTHINRRWFIKDKPDLGNIYLDNLNKLVTKKQARALKEYKETFLDQHLVLSKLYQEQFLAWCYSFAHTLGLKLCLLPAFDENPFFMHIKQYPGNIANSLVGVDEAEFVGRADKKYDLFHACEVAVDRRLCHMSEPNHTVLAQKIFKFFKYGEIIDLQNGFERNLFKNEQDVISYRPRDV
jgi:hypothetical protein